MKPIDVLLVEDNPGDAFLIADMLSGISAINFNLTTVDRLSKAVDFLSKKQVDIVLLDLGLPDSVGLDTIRCIKAIGDDSPIVVLTGLDDEQTGIAAVQVGAQDYLVKNTLRGKMLHRVISYAIERHCAKVKLSESEGFMRSTLNALSAHIAILDANGTIQTVNRAWETFARANNATRHKVMEGSNYLDVCDRVNSSDAQDTRDAVAFGAGIRNVIDGGIDLFEMEYSCHDSANKRWFQGRVTPFPTDKPPRRTVVAHENITQRMAAELSLQASERAVRKRRDFLHTLLETIPSPVFYKDLDFRYSGCNSAFESFVGIPRKSLIGKSVFDLFPSPIADKYNEMDAKLVADGGLQHYEGKVAAGNGRERDVIFDKTLLKNESGRATGLIGVITDVTERNLAEKEKRKLEDQLRIAQKMEAIGTLAGGIAHDFNNILSAIIGYTDLALDQVEGNRGLVEDLTEVANAGRRAKNLVAQILAFSRQSEMEAGPVQIHLLIKEVLKMLRATLPTTIQIEQNINTFGKILADPAQIHQVLMNLCTNAYHAMRESGGVLTVDLHETMIEPADVKNHFDPAPGRYLKLTVTDTGMGMDQKTQARIFEPYFTTKPKEEGTGLGLSVVYGIVKAIGGHISVRSSPGRGASFTLLAPKLKRTESPAQVGDGRPMPRGSERILLVDDEATLVEMTSRTLRKLGYQVDGFTSGIDALAHFQNHPRRYDLVLSDVTMPQITGDRLTQKLLHIRPNIPVVLCTGFSERLDHACALQMGARALLLKPLVRIDVAQVIRAVLDGKTVPDPGKLS